MTRVHSQAQIPGAVPSTKRIRRGDGVSSWELCLSIGKPGVLLGVLGSGPVIARTLCGIECFDFTAIDLLKKRIPFFD